MKKNDEIDIDIEFYCATFFILIKKIPNCY